MMRSTRMVPAPPARRLAHCCSPRARRLGGGLRQQRARSAGPARHSPTRSPPASSRSSTSRRSTSARRRASSPSATSTSTCRPRRAARPSCRPSSAAQYQFGFSNVVSLLLAQSRNLPIKVVSNGINSTGDPAKDFGGLVVKDPADHQPEGPRRQEGRDQHAEEHRRHLGQGDRAQGRRRPVKVTFVELPFPDMAAGAGGRQVDAIFVVEPFLLGRPWRKGWKMIGTYADVDPNLCVALYFTSTQLVAEQPDLVAAVHRGDEGVAGLRRRPPGRGPRGARQLHADHRGGPGQA